MAISEDILKKNVEMQLLCRLVGERGKNGGNLGFRILHAREKNIERYVILPITLIFPKLK